MKNNTKLVVAGFIGLISIFSCSSPSAEEGTNSQDSVDTVTVEEVMEEEVVEEASPDLDWASDLKVWITSNVRIIP